MKKYIIFIIMTIFVGSILLIGCSNKSSISFDEYMESESFDSEELKRYIEKDSFSDFSTSNFSNKIFEAEFWEQDKILRIEHFFIKLIKDEGIAAMSFQVIDESKEPKRGYIFTYNRENDYFLINDYSVKDTLNRNMSVTDFFETFDQIKNNIEFPEGDYAEYAIELMSPNITMDMDDIHIINQSNSYISNKDKVKGLYFMVYGEPIKGDDKPIFYVLPK